MPVRANLEPRKCEGCGVEFTPVKFWQKFHSRRCQKTTWNETHGTTPGEISKVMRHLARRAAAKRKAQKENKMAEIMETTQSVKEKIKIGQVYEDLDKRRPRRMLRVVGWEDNKVILFTSLPSPESILDQQLIIWPHRTKIRPDRLLNTSRFRLPTASGASQ